MGFFFFFRNFFCAYSETYKLIPKGENHGKNGK